MLLGRVLPHQIVVIYVFEPLHWENENLSHLRQMFFQKSNLSTSVVHVVVVVECGGDAYSGAR